MEGLVNPLGLLIKLFAYYEGPPDETSHIIFILHKIYYNN